MNVPENDAWKRRESKNSTSDGNRDGKVCAAEKKRGRRSNACSNRLGVDTSKVASAALREKTLQWALELDERQGKDIFQFMTEIHDVNTGRLVVGVYFALLLDYWMRFAPAEISWKNVHSGLQVRNLKTKTTLGALKLLAERRKSFTSIILNFSVTIRMPKRMMMTTLSTSLPSSGLTTPSRCATGKYSQNESSLLLLCSNRPGSNDASREKA